MSYQQECIGAEPAPSLPVLLPLRTVQCYIATGRRSQIYV